MKKVVLRRAVIPGEYDKALDYILEKESYDKCINSELFQAKLNNGLILLSFSRYPKLFEEIYPINSREFAGIVSEINDKSITVEINDKLYYQLNFESTEYLAGLSYIGRIENRNDGNKYSIVKNIIGFHILDTNRQIIQNWRN